MHRHWKRRFERQIPLYDEGVLSDSQRRRFERELAKNEQLADALRRYGRLMGTVKRLRPVYPPRAKWEQFLPQLHRRIEETDREQPNGWYAHLIRRLYNRLESPAARPRWLEKAAFGLAGAALGAAAAFYLGQILPPQNGGAPLSQGRQIEQAVEQTASNNIAFEEPLVEDFGGPHHLIADPSRE
ncbi:MAG: hypothetical protein OXT69_15270 [Candidatus Poribacteria bacterium]|nr:hypothetical protein [Candidatus Poribacteria bacterium]